MVIVAMELVMVVATAMVFGYGNSFNRFGYGFNRGF